MDPITTNLIATLSLFVLFAVLTVSSYAFLVVSRLAGNFITFYVAKAAGWKPSSTQNK